MTGTTRRLVGLVARASRQQSRLAAQGGQFRSFAAMPATTNEDEYRRFQAVKEKAHITVSDASRQELSLGRREWPGWAGATRDRVPSSASRPPAPPSARSGRRRATSRWRLWTRRWCVFSGAVPPACTATCSLVAPHAGGHHRAREEPPVEGEPPAGEAKLRLVCRAVTTRLVSAWRAVWPPCLAASHSRVNLSRHPPPYTGPGAHPVRELRVCVRYGGRRLSHGASQRQLCSLDTRARWAQLTAPTRMQTNKYSEGYPGARYYGGNEFIDMAERCGTGP